MDALAADATLPPRTRAALDLHMADVVGMGNCLVSTPTFASIYDRQ